MPLRQMQVLGGGLQVAVPEQNLDGAQVGARLQQVSRPTVAQRVRGDALADAGALRGIATCNPDGFVRNGLIESGLTGAGGEQIESGLPPAPVLTQGFQQGWTQRQITILAALAFHHADDHPLAATGIYLLGVEIAGSPHSQSPHCPARDSCLLALVLRAQTAACLAGRGSPHRLDCRALSALQIASPDPNRATHQTRTCNFLITP